MSDLVITAVVLLAVGGIGLLIFLRTGARKSKADYELTEYCREHGCTISKTRKPLYVELHIEGDSFSLTSKMVTSNSSSGMDSRGENTVWSTRGGNSLWPSFALGSIPAAGEWEKLPDMIKKAAIDKLMSETGVSFNPANARQVDTAGPSTFLLFEETPGESADTVQRLKPLLNDWPAKYILFIHSSPKMVRIQVAECFIEDAKLLDKIMRLGSAATNTRM